MSFDLIDRKFGAKPKPAESDFRCHVCGVETPVALDYPRKTVCPEHCEDHDYRFDDTVGFVCCMWCCQEAPVDWSSR